jgi:hypothetical protein
MFMRQEAPNALNFSNAEFVRLTFFKVGIPSENLPDIF